MRRFVVAAVVVAAALPVGLAAVSAGRPEPAQPAASPDWRAILADRVPRYGHRNWVVIADAAYPSQTGAGVETVVTHAGQLDVVKGVLEELGRHKHVRPVVYLDAELSHVPEADSAGIGAYRAGVAPLLGGRNPVLLPHDEIIAKLGRAGTAFSVLVLKSTMTLPYTSVFLELDCGYWSPEAEQRLRDAMKK